MPDKCSGGLQTELDFILCCAGAVLVIVIVFMAVTSSGASEMVAISSLFTFDVYRRYIDPKVSWAPLLSSAPLLLLTPLLEGANIISVLRDGASCAHSLLGWDRDKAHRADSGEVISGSMSWSVGHAVALHWSRGAAWDACLWGHDTNNLP